MLPRGYTVIAGSAALLLLSPTAKAEQVMAPDEQWRPFRSHPETGQNPSPLKADQAVPTLERSIAETDATALPLEGNPDTFRVGSILIETQAPLDHAVFDQVIEPYLGTDMDQRGLAKLAQQIADVARAKGLILADALVPSQDVELGIIRVVLTPGTIDEVRINGSSNTALRDLLEPLTGQVTTQKELEHRLMLANNIPQITIKKTEMVQEGDRRILLVTVGQRKKLSGQAVLDNYGTKAVGPLRARLSVETAALIDDSDYMNVTFRVNPTEPGELVAASTVYGIGLNNAGTRAEIAAAWSHSSMDPWGGFDGRAGNSRYAALSLNHPIRRSRTANLWADGQIEYLEVEQESFRTTMQSDTVVTLSLGMSSSLKVGNGWIRTGTQLRQGLGVLGASGTNSSLSSRFDADGIYTSGRAWANWSGKLAGDVTLRLAISGQLASEPLLASEEMGVGGAFSGRAFDFYERSGDQGVIGLAELGYEFSRPFRWLERFQPYAFVDGGYVDNLGLGLGGGTLVSAGGGVRAAFGRIGVQLEAATPIVQTGQLTENGESKVNLQVGIDF